MQMPQAWYMLPSQQEKQLLGNVVMLELWESAQSPVVRLRAQVCARTFPPPYVICEITHQGHCLFAGNIDRQQNTLHGNNQLDITLEARSQGSALLENQAQPGTLWGCNLATLFARHIAPHGFVLHGAHPGTTLPEFTIRHGWSEWQALCAFCSRSGLGQPQVRGNTVCLTPLVSPKVWKVCNHAPGIRFTAFSQIHRPVEYISEIILPQRGSGEAAVFKHNAPLYQGLQRRHYLTPTNEYDQQTTTSATQMLEQAYKRTQQYKLELPNWPKVTIGDIVEMLLPEQTPLQLMVAEHHKSFTATTQTTQLTLYPATI